MRALQWVFDQGLARPAGFTRNLSKINSSPYGRLAGVLRATRWSNRQSLRAHQSDQYKKPANSRLCILARPAGLEPATSGLEGRCSIQLSYERIVAGSQLYRLADSGVYFTSIKRTHHCVSWESYARLRRPVLYPANDHRSLSFVLRSKLSLWIR